MPALFSSPMSGDVARRLALLLLLVAVPFIVRPQLTVAGDLPEPWAALARQADVIALGECASETSSWNDEGNLITTAVQVRLNRVFKGAVTRAVTVKTLGGRVGDESMAASHGASLAAGEQVLLFLKRSEFGDYYVVAGGEPGKVVVGEVPAEWPAAPSAGTLAELARLLSRAAAQP